MNRNEKDDDGDPFCSGAEEGRRVIHFVLAACISLLEYLKNLMTPPRSTSKCPWCGTMISRLGKLVNYCANSSDLTTEATMLDTGCSQDYSRQRRTR
jgi:hypothetical protein